MIDAFTILASNFLVASLIAGLALLLDRSGRHRSFVHALWVIALVKLITPPIIALPWIPIDQFVEVTRQEGSVLEATREFDLRHRSPFLTTDSGANWIPNRPFRDWVPEDGLEFAESAETIVPSISDPLSGSYEGPASRRVTTMPPPNEPRRVTGPLIITGLFYAWLLGGAVWLCRVYLSGRRMRRVLQLVSKRDTLNEKKIDGHVKRVAVLIGLAQRPQILITHCNIVPMIWATWGRTTLVLPHKLLNNMQSPQIDALIAHELAHLRCHHHWVRRLEIVVMTFYWWCPLVWLARRKLRESEEEICDAWVTHIMPECAEDYANALVDTLAFLNSKTPSIPMAAMGISQFQLLNRRITMIMQDDRKPGLSLAGWLVLFAVLSLGIPFSPSTAVSDGPAGDTANSISVYQDEDEDEDRDEDDDSDRDDDRDEDEAGEEDEDDEDARDEDQDDWDRENFDIDEMVDELVEELTEELEEMDSEIMEEIDEIREDLKEGFDEAPPIAKRAASQMNLNQIVRRALRDAPQSARMFVNEVDPAGIMDELTKNVDWDEDEFDEDEIESMQDKLEEKFTRSISEVVDRVNHQIRQAREEVERGLGELPDFARRQLAQKNLLGIIDKITEDTSPITRQFIDDADIKNHIRRALGQNRGDEDPARREARDRDDDTRSQQRVRDRQRERERRTDRDRGDARDDFDNRRRRGSRTNRERNQRSDDVLQRRHELEDQIEQMMDQLDRLKQELRELNRRDRSPEPRRR